MAMIYCTDCPPPLAMRQVGTYILTAMGAGMMGLSAIGGIPHKVVVAGAIIAR